MSAPAKFIERRLRLRPVGTETQYQRKAAFLRQPLQLLPVIGYSCRTRNLMYVARTLTVTRISHGRRSMNCRFCQYADMHTATRFSSSIRGMHELSEVAAWLVRESFVRLSRQVRRTDAQSVHRP